MSRSRPAAVSSARAMASASRRMASRSRGDLADDPDGQPRAGERVPPDDRGGQPELLADGADLVLEQGPQRLDQPELQVVGQPADVVVALDVGRALAAAGLDHVRVERALDQELDVAGSPPTISRAAASKVRMNSRPMILRLVSGSVTPASASRNWLGGVDHLQVDAGRGDEVPLDLLGLALAQQPVVDEHAGQLVADRALHQCRGHGGVDPAGQPADHVLVADLRRGSPRPSRRRCWPRVQSGRAAGDVVQEAARAPAGRPGSAAPRGATARRRAAARRPRRRRSARRRCWPGR